MNQEQKKLPQNLEIRYTEPGDAEYLKMWLSDPSIAKWFPIEGNVEIDDAVNRWIGFYRYRCSLTATIDGVPCGIVTLYLQPYTKIAHQCEFGIIVGSDYRNQGIGSDLMKNIIHLAKEYFHIELLHLQVYENNPAIRLYERFGFKEFGRQSKWIKEKNKSKDESKDGSNAVYVGRIFLEKSI